MRGGILFKLVLFLAVVGALAGLVWMLFLPEFAMAQLRKRTGFDGSIQSLAVNPFAGTIALRGLVLENPPDFPDRDFLQLREFDADIELSSLISGPLIFDEMTIDVARITIVTRAHGRSNVEALQGNVQSPSVAADRGAGSVGSAADTRVAQRPFLIRRLNLRFGRLVVVDFSEGRTQPEVREFPLGLDHTYRDVTDVRTLFPPDALQHIAPLGAAINGLVSGDIGRALADAAEAAAQSAAALWRGAGRTAGEKVKGFLGGLEESKKP